MKYIIGEPGESVVVYTTCLQRAIKIARSKVVAPSRGASIEVRDANGNILAHVDADSLEITANGYRQFLAEGEAQG